MLNPPSLEHSPTLLGQHPGEHVVMRIAYRRARGQCRLPPRLRQVLPRRPRDGVIIVGRSEREHGVFHITPLLLRRLSLLVLAFLLSFYIVMRCCCYCWSCTRAAESNPRHTAAWIARGGGGSRPCIAEPDMCR